jgi:integrase
MSNPPSERELQRVERELKKLRPGAQRAVGGGVYMRLDRSGRRRFQGRTRQGGGQPGRTHDTWEAAKEANGVLAEALGEVTGAGPTAAQIRTWTIARYAAEAWWPTVLDELDVQTHQDYRRGLKDLLPHLGKTTLAELEATPLLIDELKRKIKAAKTFPPGHKRAGQLPKAAADKPLKVLSAICGHAVERRVLTRNPMAGVRRFNRRRSAAGSADAPSHRPVMASEVKHPYTIPLAGSGMRASSPAELERRRLIPELIEVGMRPSDILAMRNRWWRDSQGLLPQMHIEAAVKNLAGHLLEGEPKTGARDIYLFDAIAERLERIYQLEDCPPLDAFTFPNRNGGLLQWGNWRDRAWYPALHRAGLSDGPTAEAAGAFWPYQCRHVGVTTMLHAERPEGGTYSEREVARQFGHTVATLDRVYADIPTDMHGIAGLTMDEILRGARRQVWGPMPGDDGYEPVEYDLIEAAELSGVDNKALAARIQRGSLPGLKRHGKYYVTRFDLAWCGLLLPPASA